MTSSNSVKQIKSRDMADAYIQRFIIPLLERVGLKVSVKHTSRTFTLIVKLPHA